MMCADLVIAASDGSSAFFFLTFECSDSIYESRCDFLNRKFELENQSMKNATKKAVAKKKAAPKKKK
jgi:hypothetical protein